MVKYFFLVILHAFATTWSISPLPTDTLFKQWIYQWLLTVNTKPEFTDTISTTNWIKFRLCPHFNSIPKCWDCEWVCQLQPFESVSVDSVANETDSNGSTKCHNSTWVSFIQYQVARLVCNQQFVIHVHVKSMN